jgi:hypothetical protein
MTRWDAVTPHYSYLSAEPFTPEEIDNHLNRERIWATIMDIRYQWNKDVQDHYRYAEENLK